MAAADYYTQVYTMFVAYFGRPPAKSGLDNYAALVDKAGGNVAVVIDDFFKSDESKAFFAGKSVEQQVNQIFQNVFGRDALPEGLSYWTNLINSGTVALAQAAYTIAFNAAPADVAVRDAKIASAKAWVAGLDTTNEILVYSTDGGRTAGRDFLSTIKTSTPATQESVDAALKAMVDGGTTNPGQTYVLTTGTDTFTGTVGNDTFVANTAVVVDPATGNQNNTDTLQAVDTLNGGAGVDTLKISTASGTVTLPTISNVEIIEVAQSLGNLSINTTTVAGLTNLNVTKVAAGKTVAATAAATTDVSVAMKAAGAAVGVDGGKNVTVKLTDVAGASDAVTVGGTTAPKGDVAVEMTGAKSVAATSATLSAVTVTGGKTVSVTQKATSDASAAAADTVGATITQGDIAINGNADTTTVMVKQDAAVTAKTATNTTGGVTETASVKFGVLKNGDVLVSNGLTFTASADLTAAEVAAVFANLVNGTLPVAGDTQGSGLASKGTYTGVFTTSGTNGWTSAAASGDTVVFTAATKNTNVATDLAFALTNTSGSSVAPVVTTTQGKGNDATATGGVLGVVAGKVTVADGGSTIKTVTVDGYGAGSALTGTAVVETLKLSNGGAFTSSNAAATLNLTLEKVNGVYTQTAGAATLNVKSVGANTAGLAAANSTALNVSGSGLLNASTGSVLTALTTIKVTETAGLNLGATTLTNVTSVDTTGTTGAVTVAVDSTKATYAGGAGADTVTFTNTTAASKAIDLGAGNDTLVFATGSVAPTVVLQGGAGDDSVSLTAADAVTFSGSTAFAAQLNSFERLVLTGATGAQAVDLGKLGFTNHVTVAGGAGTLTLNDLANNGTLVLTANGGAIVANIKDAATGTADVLNVQLVKDTALTGGTLTAANVETVNITSTDTSVPPTTGAAIDTHTLTLTADKATTVNVTGNAGLTLTLTGSTKVTSIDGSTMTAGLTATSLNTTAATTIKGGSGNDVLAAAAGTTADVLLGGAGDDTLTANAGLTTLTGGSGNDLFVIGTASANVNSYATVTDFAAGDLLKITGATQFAASKVVLADTAVFQDYANAAVNVNDANGAVTWFQFGGNTYVVMDADNGTADFQNGTDFIVKLTGLVNLTNASFNNTQDTIALV